jgi:hypothetical protein
MWFPWKLQVRDTPLSLEGLPGSIRLHDRMKVSAVRSRNDLFMSEKFYDGAFFVV